MKPLLFALAALTPTATWAGYIQNKGMWDELSAHKKHGYVMGFMDSYLTRYVRSDRQWSVQGYYEQCLIDLDIRSDDLVEVVETTYSDLENWDKSADKMLAQGIYKVCKATIERLSAQGGD
ncbi:MAG: hypothetical protein JXQ91_13300 [Vannielia sp.]|uniref:hypothetical protein n=1 Tax=Vannielia sp. TaxID=2813045 RepID=UPI003B8CC649